MQVQWKVKGIFKADAAKVYKEIGSKNVTPEKILEKARDENSELHKCFEWDDSVAAEKWRLVQARQIIQLIVTVPDKKEEPPKRVFQISSEKNTYQPMSFFVKNEDEATILLQRAIEELRAFEKRYSSLKGELEEVFEAIEKIA